MKRNLEKALPKEICQKCQMGEFSPSDWECLCDFEAPLGFYCPVCDQWYKQSKYIKSVFGDYKMRWVANMVTHYRHAHTDWDSVCYYLPKHPTVDEYPIPRGDNGKLMFDVETRRIIRHNTNWIIDAHLGKIYAGLKRLFNDRCKKEIQVKTERFLKANKITRRQWNELKDQLNVVPPLQEMPKLRS